tara:strand:+ start:463 stop:657 length:195 start_codon:yes stop_codon:yes gene_type:complete
MMVLFVDWFTPTPVTPDAPKAHITNGVFFVHIFYVVLMAMSAMAAIALGLNVRAVSCASHIKWS